MVRYAVADAWVAFGFFDMVLYFMLQVMDIDELNMNLVVKMLLLLKRLFIQTLLSLQQQVKRKCVTALK